MDSTDLRLYPQPRLCQLNLKDCCGICIFTVELLWTIFENLLPSPTTLAMPHLLSTNLFSYAGPILVRNSKKSPEMA